MAGQVLALRGALDNLQLKKDKKKKKKKRRSRSRSSGSSSHSSSSSSCKANEKYVQWTGRDRDTPMTAKLLAKMESLRFRRRSDLLNFSAKYPGALGAAFLIQLKAKLHGGAPR
eukprot:8249302-Lingulodinium_polyedra.AAC.1